MNEHLPPNPERPATEPVIAGPVTGFVPGAGPAQARWARIGLFGIGAAGLLAAAALVFGSTASPAGTLAAGTDSTATSNGIAGLHGGPGFGGRAGPFGGISITAISGNSLSLATEDGWTRTITIDDGTTYTKAGKDITLADLAVGDMVGFRQTLEDDGTYSIDSIAVILPHVGGQVTAVDGSTITVELRGGTTEVVKLNGDTNVVVNGDAATAADIKVGMFLVAEGTENADGSLDATRVRAGTEGPGSRDGFGGRGFNGPGFRGMGPGFGDGDGGGPNGTTAPDATDSAS